MDKKSFAKVEGMVDKNRKNGLLKNARVYLTGPMDFVASRIEERNFGWRVRMGQFLRSFGATVLDPWNKPDVLGLHEYGREDEDTPKIKDSWIFESTREGAIARNSCAQKFREVQHIDLRMVDACDFMIAHCPTNIYSVGTPHEIIVGRWEHKPILFVSPPVIFPALDKLKRHLKDDEEGRALLKDLEKQVPIKPNPKGIPSLWYMPLVGSERFFDGFGFLEYEEEFGAFSSPSDVRERRFPPKRPLLPFLEKINRVIPKKWDRGKNKFVSDDDWLLLDIEEERK